MNIDGSERQATARWTPPIRLVVGLAVLLAANYYLRHTLEESPRRLYSFLDYFYPSQVPIIFGKLPIWRLFLPLRELTGAWVTTTVALTYLVERVLTPAGAWELFNAVSIVVAFVTSWILFRSAVFSFTLAISVGFGTQFYHAYAVAGGIASYLLVTYHMLLLFTAVLVIRGDRPRWAWQLAFAVSLILNVIGYEGWLDVLVLVWVACPFVFVGLWRLGRCPEAWRLVRLALAMTAVGVAYVVVKVTLGYGQTQGSESDVVFNYTSIWPILDDVISNVFTHAYLSISNFFPPILVGASAFYRLGSEYLVDAQHRYHEPFTYLVPMHQIFFWRYYAGGAFVIVVYGVYATAIRAWKKPAPWTLALGVFLIMILVGGPTHTLVKFRPMNSTPVLGYHVTVGVLGMSLVISWLLTTAWREMKDRRHAGLVIAVVWTTIFYGALARPPYLAHMAAQAGLGESIYPNPMKKLVEAIGRTYEAPKGLALYRLLPYQPDAGLAQVRAQLPDLPGRLDAIQQWKASQHVSFTIVEGVGVDVEGDDSQAGYQLVSPLVPLQPSTHYLLRVRFDVRQGRVCVGVLSGDQQRWLVSPSGTTAEYEFDSGNLDGVRVVLANCFATDTGNPRSRFRAYGGSYAAVLPPK